MGDRGINASVVPCVSSDSDEVIFRFLILDAPSPSTLPSYISLLTSHGVRHVARACGPTYDSELLEHNGIQVHSLMFDDGAVPPPDVVSGWLTLLEREWQEHRRLCSTVPVGEPFPPPPTIGVHCVAGLGRAPILVAIALVEYGNMAPLDAVGYVRERRSGAINQVQLHWIVKYRPRRVHSSEGMRTCSTCAVM